MRVLSSLLPLAATAFAAGLDLEQIPLPADEATAQPYDFLELKSGVEPLEADAIPLLGFGTWRLTDNCSQAVSWAIQTGYRHLDCAAAYGNEEEVGRGIRDGLFETGLTRDDLWITSKLWNDHHDKVEEGIDETIAKLGVGYLNLYLMHWPVASAHGINTIDYLNTWHAMESLVDTGKTRHIGVANFSPKEIEVLLEKSKSHPPQVHQMELHPYLQQPHFIDWHKQRGIHVTAYSPLAQTNPIYTPGEPPALLNNSVINSIADDRGCTPAQVAIMWGMARGTSVIPKSSHNERITENFRSLECILEGEDFEKIERLGKEHYRFNNPSQSWDVPLYEGLEDSRGKHEEDR